MLKVLLVDDDVVIRTNLKTLIEWEQYGFTIADEAVNGVECIQKMSTAHYDLVITDMSMPIMGGVALLESIRKYYPYVEVIAISGYDDYHYVRDSLKKGAIDYVLKHKLNREILCELLDTVKNRIMERDQVLYRSSLQSEQLSEGKALMIHILADEILNGAISLEEAKKRMEILEIDCEFTNLTLCYLEVQNFPKLSQTKENRVIKSFIDIVEKIIMEDSHGFVAHLEKGKFIAFIDFRKVNSILYTQQAVAGIVSRICSTSKKYMGFHTIVAVSSICNKFDKIPEFYEKTLKSLKDTFYYEEQFVWQNNQVPKADTQLALSIKDEENIRQLLEEKNEEGISSFLDILFERCCIENVAVRSVQIICAELVSIAIQFCIKHSLDRMRDELGELQLLGDYINKKFVELKKLMKQIYQKVLLEYSAILEESGSNRYVIKAIQYVNSNYCNNISLTDTANYVGVSSQYMSRLIHEECKKSFADLLNGKRIEMACQMIRSHDYKVKEIAIKAGFNNYNYFFKVFKEITGLTPAEYEKKDIRKES